MNTVTKMGCWLLGTLASTASWCADAPWVPRTTEHFRCVFKDDTYVEFKKIQKWFPYAEVVAHAQTYASWKTLTYYVDARGRKLEIELPVNEDCEAVGKANGRLFYRNGYQDKRGAFLLFDAPENAAVPASPFTRVAEVVAPPEPGCSKSNRDRRLVEKGIHELMFCGSGWLMRESATDEIVAETPVWSRGNDSSYPVYGVVHYVFRAIYNRESKQWSTVELVDDGRIYEIGKTLTGQSWAPRYQCLVDRPRGGCDKR